MPDNAPIDFRIDFVFVGIRENPDGTVTLISRPNPDKYERIVRKGRTWLRDRFTHIMFDEQKMMRQVAESSLRLPVRYEPARIKDQADWVRGRIDAIQALLSGDGKSQLPVSRSHEELVTQLDTDRSFLFVTVAVRNAIDLGRLSSTEAAAINGTLSHELALAAYQHRGSLWRSSSTSYSFYFAAPNLIAKVDLGLAFATTARDLLDVINRLLRDLAWPEVSVGIGVEAGSAVAHIAGLPEHYTTVDLAGVAVAAAEGLAREASRGEIFVGPKGARLAHASWQRLMTPVDPQPSVSVPDLGRIAGTVFRLAPEAHGSSSVITGGPGVDAP